MSAEIFDLGGRRLPQPEPEDRPPYLSGYAPRPKPVLRSTVKDRLGITTRAKHSPYFIPHGKGDAISVAEETMAEALDALAKIGDATGEKIETTIAHHKGRLETARQYIIKTKATGLTGAAAKLRMAGAVGFTSEVGSRLVAEVQALMDERFPLRHRQDGDEPGGAA